MTFIPTLTMNPSVDKSALIDRVVPEQKLRCKTPRYEPGGGGINVARAIGKLGGKALAVYPAGRASGQMLQDLLEQEGVEIRSHQRQPSGGSVRQGSEDVEEVA